MGTKETMSSRLHSPPRLPEHSGRLNQGSLDWSSYGSVLEASPALSLPHLIWVARLQAHLVFIQSSLVLIPSGPGSHDSGGLVGSSRNTPILVADHGKQMIAGANRTESLRVMRTSLECHRAHHLNFAGAGGAAADFC